MARSRQKTPIFGVTTSSNTFWNRKVRRAFRHQEKAAILREDFDNLPVRKDEICDAWRSPQDGKHWMGDMDPKHFRK